jgi:membrane protein
MTTAMRRFVAALAADLTEGELLTYASAIAFRTLFAAIPLALVLVALVGFLDLAPVWTAQIAPSLRPKVGDAAFVLIDGTVRQVLASRELFWLTLGLATAVWQLSSAVRVTADALNRLYGVENQRSMTRWLGTSIAVSFAVGLCLLVAAVAIYFGSEVAVWVVGPSGPASVGGFLLGWALAIAAMLAAVALLLHFMPGERVTWHFARTGALVTVVAWGLATAAFGAYITWVSNYGSIYGSLAVPFVLFLYFNFAALIFLIGVWLERRRHTGVERPLQVDTTDTVKR